MISKYTKFVVFCLTVLFAMILSEYIETKFDQGNSLKGIAIKMLVTVAVYVPVFSILERYLEKASEFYASKSKKVAKNSYLGLTLGFIIALLTCYWLLVYIITGKNLLNMLF